MEMAAERSANVWKLLWVWIFLFYEVGSSKEPYITGTCGVSLLFSIPPPPEKKEEKNLLGTRRFSCFSENF